MAVLDVIKMGNPTLRDKAKEVDLDSITSAAFQQFLDELVETMRLQEGVGIAAPQVAQLKRIFVMELTKNKRYPERPSFPLSIAINPSLELLGNEQVNSWEGCLSIPGIRGRLKRHKKVKLTAYDENGIRYSKELSDFPAIVAQHEFDHLNGILLIDRMESMETLTFQEEYERYWI